MIILGGEMKKLIVFNLIFCIIFILSGINTNASQNSSKSEQIFEITEQVINKIKVTKISSTKESRGNTKSYELEYLEIANRYELNNWQIKDRDEITIYEELIEGEFSPEQSDEMMIKSVSNPGEYDDPEGYLTIRTVISSDGYNFFGDKSYIVTVTVKYAGNYDNSYQAPTFGIRGEDRLVIGHGSGAYYNSERTSIVDGHYQFYSKKPADLRAYVTTWSVTQGFLIYTDFLDTKINLANKLNVNNHFHGDKECMAIYPISLTSNTSLNAVYIHNERLFGGKLSISAGAYGFSLSISGAHTDYSMTPISLSA